MISTRINLGLPETERIQTLFRTRCTASIARFSMWFDSSFVLIV